MAASLRASSSPDRKPLRQRHGGHDIRRRDSYNRRPRTREQSARRSPQRQLQPWPSRIPSPTSTPNTSTLSSLYVEPSRNFAMERTPSGNSIISDSTYEPEPSHNTLRPCSDDGAASRVKRHIRRKPPHGKYERILRRLIESREPIDKDDVETLDGVLTAADVLFFDGALKGRVRWDWSDPEQPRYQTELIGTTALREAQDHPDGWETLIVLSDPILNNPDYDRRLLLSAFLHELIHCYLFITCGRDAKINGGHTEGFHDIANIIDKWVGPDSLQLCNMKANLNHFRNDSTLRSMDTRLEMLARPSQHSHDLYTQSTHYHGEPQLQETFYIRPGRVHDHRPTRDSYGGCDQIPRPHDDQMGEIIIIRETSRETGLFA